MTPCPIIQLLHSLYRCCAVAGTIRLASRPFLCVVHRGCYYRAWVYVPAVRAMTVLVNLSC